MKSQVLLLFLTFATLSFCRVPIDRFSDPCIFIDCNKYKAKTMTTSTPKPLETGVFQAQIVNFLAKSVRVKKLNNYEFYFCRMI